MDPFLQPIFSEASYSMKIGIWISIKISLMSVRKDIIDNDSVLFQVMAWRRRDDKLLSEPMMTQLSDAYVCVIRPQWVNIWSTKHQSFEPLTLLWQECTMSWHGSELVPPYHDEKETFSALLTPCGGFHRSPVDSLPQWTSDVELWWFLHRYP